MVTKSKKDPKEVRETVQQRINHLAELSLLLLARRCAAHCMVTMHEMLGPTHAASAFRARRLLAGALHLRSQLSSVEIGRIIGRDHTTVLSMLQRTSVSEINAVDPDTRELPPMPPPPVRPRADVALDLCSARMQ